MKEKTPHRDFKDARFLSDREDRTLLGILIFFFVVLCIAIGIAYHFSHFTQ